MGVYIMEIIDKDDKYRFENRRRYNLGPPVETGERRSTNRREDDRFGAWLKIVLDKHMEEIVPDDLVKRVLKHIKANGKAKAY